MDKEQRQAARRQMVTLMQAGQGWQEAARLSGVQVGRSTAYRLLQAFRVRGEAVFQDGRHGHPAKLREPELTFLEAVVKPAPEIPSRQLQAALSKEFGITVSIGHLNHVRSQLGLGSRTARRKKNRSSCIQPSNAQISMAQEHCFSSRRHTKQAWSPC
jgi:transposase